MLFGHQNDSNQSAAAPALPDIDQLDGVNPLAVDPATGASLPVAPDEPTIQPSAPVTPDPTPSFASFTPDPVAPVAAPDPVVADTPALDPVPEPVADTPALSSAPDTDDLLAMKQQALEQLSPLVGKLEQTPEEKFRTTMMMIQSTDNQSLLKDAYEAAQAIPDEKAKAQALLDVVNEINYFTQQKS